MNKQFLIALLFHVCVLQAQTLRSVRPVSFSNQVELPPPALVNLTPPLSIELEAMDRSEQKNGILPKFARWMTVDVSPDYSGQWHVFQDGSMLWRVQLSAAGALGLIPLYDEFHLPVGAFMHVYTPGREEVIGAFTYANNPASGYYNTGLIADESCVIEVFVPAGKRSELKLHIHQVGYAYRWVKSVRNKADREFGDSEYCQVNPNCSEGDDWQAQKRSVARILVVTSDGAGWCSGALVNNVRQDCTQYFLTAQHCAISFFGNTEATAANLAQWVFYFNYEAPGCSNPSNDNAINDDFVTGCVKVASSKSTTGSNLGSDFFLCTITPPLPNSFNVHYAGWSNVNQGSPSGVSIHHPSGDIKKISTYNTLTTTTGWYVNNSHWNVQWVATANGHGVTEGGSSGSPLFNSSGKLMGTLTGGSSFCNDPLEKDQYGKMSYHWASNSSTTTTRQLKPWLDPDNTGATELNGTNVPCTGPSGCGNAKLALHTDNFGSQTTWEILSPGGQTIMSGGPYSNVNGGELFLINLCLEPGCYFFVMYDSQGNGMGVNGSATITDSLNTVTYAQLQNNSFGFSTSIQFCVTTDVDEMFDSSIRLVPNPATHSFRVQSDLPVSHINVFDAAARLLISHESNSAVDINRLAAGIYMVECVLGSNRKLHKLVVN